MLLLPVKLVETLAKKNGKLVPFIEEFAREKGDPIDSRAAELMRLLHHARLSALANSNEDLGIDFSKEPGHLFFDFKKLLKLLKEVENHVKFNHLAVCPALTLLGDDGKPVAPNEEQITLMEKAVEAELDNRFADFAKIMRSLKLVQTVILAGCDANGAIIVDEPASGGSTSSAANSAFKYYDFAGQCCNTVKGRDKVKCIRALYQTV